MVNEKFIFELKPDELKWWAAVIKDFRNKIIRSPNEYLDKTFQENKFKDPGKLKISEYILNLRSATWDLYIHDEYEFHKAVVEHLVLHRDLPKEILLGITESSGLDTVVAGGIKADINHKLGEIIGDFSGRIMPYFYELSKSTTNSRRSRAGKTFEAVMEHVFCKYYDYPYDDQSSLGSKFYEENGIGKMVDGIMPSSEAYLKNRNKCLVITMKTTLRERWQEVVEELNRTNMPHIYLLTLDEGLTEPGLQTMKQHNITVVSYEYIAAKHPKMENLISFEQFLNKEIPHAMEHWK